MSLYESNIKILKRNQKTQGNANYYFSPIISFELYNAKVIFINPKFLVFEFDKYKCSTLFNLLQKSYNVLQNELKKNYSELFDKNIYSFIAEQETTFTIRCHLPNKNGKYFITCKDINQNDLKFNLPRSNINYSMVIIEVRNLWSNNDKYGFNIELKHIKYDF